MEEQNRRKIMNSLAPWCKREITDLIIHCSATGPGQIVNVNVIDSWHKQRGFKMQKESGHYCGYHFVILENGEIQTGRTLNEIGAHVSGQNSRSVGICYAGGIDVFGKAKDTRTEAQKNSIIWLLMQLKAKFPDAKIKGHRDYSPDLNGNGIIEPFEYMKECPCFDAEKEYKYLKI